MTAARAERSARPAQDAAAAGRTQRAAGQLAPGRRPAGEALVSHVEGPLAWARRDDGMLEESRKSLCDMSFGRRHYLYADDLLKRWDAAGKV